MPDPGACKHPPLTAGENIAAGDLCYVKSDGLVWRSTGAAVAAAAKVRGVAVTKANTGEPITLMYHVVLQYGALQTRPVLVALARSALQLTRPAYSSHEVRTRDRVGNYNAIRDINYP